MTFPVPAPPARRLPSAEESVTGRSGVSVRVTQKFGQYFWAVTRTEGIRVLAVDSGNVDATAAGANKGNLFAEVRAAVVRHQEDVADSVYCDGENAAEGLRTVGVAASCSFPPAAAIVALDGAVRLRMEAFRAHCTITTDASRGRNSACLGHG